MKLKVCKSCGAMVNVLEECHCKCDIECCGEKMSLVEPNSVDAAIEKHVPTYEIVDDKLKVKVNHVMEEEHYISWIALESNNLEMKVNLNAGDLAEVTFPYVEGATLYAYCNKHGLWKKEVE